MVRKMEWYKNVPTTNKPKAYLMLLEYNIVKLLEWTNDVILLTKNVSIEKTGLKHVVC